MRSKLYCIQVSIKLVVIITYARFIRSDPYVEVMKPRKTCRALHTNKYFIFSNSMFKCG